jgi:hypothetical protein
MMYPIPTAVVTAAPGPGKPAYRGSGANDGGGSFRTTATNSYLVFVGNISFCH